MGSDLKLINSKCYTNILCKSRLLLFIMPITLTCIGKKKSVTGAKTWAINMLMNSFSCLFLFIRGGCGWSWVFRTLITPQPAPGSVIIRPNMTTFPVPRPDLQSPLPAQVSSSSNERPSVKTNHTHKAISALSLDSVWKLLSGPNFTLVSALHPPHPVRELRVSSSVFRPGCSQHSVVAPSSNFNHNFVHLEALKTSQSVVFPHQPLLPQPAAGAVSSVKLPTSVIELLFCKLILIVKSVLCQDSHSSQSRGLSCCHFFTFTLFYQFTAIPRPPLPSPEFAVVYCVHFIF